ncbi:hypothetical protein BC829DRAFT_61536 [Chytridium lagenaria]|nr:hypothetical protein BC829DRAFT_61536 [Chytridium lagenaria]
MPYAPIPRVTLNFLGFPPGPTSPNPSQEAPSRRVIAELPDPMSKSSRILTISDLVVVAKRDQLAEDTGVDPSKCVIYDSAFAAISKNSSVNILRDGEALIVAYYGGKSKGASDDLHGSSKDKEKERDRDRIIGVVIKTENVRGIIGVVIKTETVNVIVIRTMTAMEDTVIVKRA